ncbi:Metallo-dependent phosphatase-like protein [Chlamydoabsidia padenii]|nr:Metallo-dependent phosphatase-like protein [Chlamydoabsidia padenii]
MADLYTMKLSSICVSLLALFPIIHGFSKDEKTGRFIQITDFHMDPHYVAGSSTSAFCHRQEGSGDVAGQFGSLSSSCDTPPALVEEAFKFMKSLPPVDFVLYTGDSARHNRDKKGIPRTYEEALDTQTTIVKHFMDTFNTSQTKVIPLIGNNDVPKNNDCSGDDPAYQEIEQVWKPLALNLEPEFQKGGYYVQDLIPGKLKVLNTNTMLFSVKNKLSKEDCDDVESPGGLHMQWLNDQLKHARAEHAKVYISAHVPPNSKRDRVFYKPVCYNQYYGLLGDYADIIVGHFAGHFNNDVLTAVVDGPGLDQFDDKKKKGLRRRGHHKKRPTTSDLHPPYGHIALLGKPDMDIPSPLPKVLGVLFNAPSIVPLNNPGVRVYEYEIAGKSAPIGTILNYKQYYADLQEANKNGKIEFKLEYDAAELYGISRFDAAGMTHILETATSKSEQFGVYTRVKNPLPPPPEDD